MQALAGFFITVFVAIMIDQLIGIMAGFFDRPKKTLDQK